MAEICREIGGTDWLDQQEPGHRQHISVGTATVALVLNGLGFSTRRLDLVSRFFVTKPVEHMVGPGITADQLHDDCLGRALDWLYTHDPTTLFAGIAAGTAALRGERAAGACGYGLLLGFRGVCCQLDGGGGVRLPCAGFSRVSKALVQAASRRLSVHRTRMLPDWSRCTTRSWRCEDPPVRNSTNQHESTAERELYSFFQTKPKYTNPGSVTSE